MLHYISIPPKLNQPLPVLLFPLFCSSGIYKVKWFGIGHGTHSVFVQLIHLRWTAGTPLVYPLWGTTSFTPVGGTTYKNKVDYSR
jgi:hypothetical protein